MINYGIYSNKRREDYFCTPQMQCLLEGSSLILGPCLIESLDATKNCVYYGIINNYSSSPNGL